MSRERIPEDANHAVARHWRIWRTDDRSRLTIEISRRALQVDWIADKYWARRSKRSPAAATIARLAMRNKKVADYYWLWRHERVNRQVDARDTKNVRVG